MIRENRSSKNKAKINENDDNKIIVSLSLVRNILYYDLWVMMYTTFEANLHSQSVNV